MCLRQFAGIKGCGFLLVVLAVLFSCQAGAQISNKGTSSNGILDNEKVISDTLGFAEKEKDNSVDIFYKNLNGERMEYDTSITLMHRFNILGDWDIDLGNLGTAYQSLKVEAALPAAYTLMPNRMNAYRFSKENIRFYNTTKPFTEVRYSVGSGQEQMIELLHTQNIKPHWNFNTRYRKISSQGFFQAQKSNIDNFEFVSDYTSPNQHYRAYAAFYYNKIQQDENLGIVDESFLTDPQFTSANIIPVVVGAVGQGIRSPILNFNRDVHASLNQSYSLGKKVMVPINDSTNKEVFKPYLTLGNEVYYTGERYCFQHNSPDSLFGEFFIGENFDWADTLNVRYDNSIVGTNFSAESNIYIGSKVFSLTGGLGIEYQKIGGLNQSQESVNNYLFGNLTNRKSKDSSWRLDADIKFYYTGMAAGNLNFSGRITKDLPKGLGQFGVDAGQYIQRPYYVAESIQVDSAVSTNPFVGQSQLNTKIGGFYANEKLRLRASFHTILFSKLIYSNGLEPNFTQEANPISIQQIQVNKEFVFGKWKSINTALIQIAPSSSPIQVPLFSSLHSLAWNSYLFKGKLQVSTGLDMRYNTPYFYDNYQPFLQSFAPQPGFDQAAFRDSSFQQIMIPRLNPFFNFKIKRFRASFNFDQVQHFILRNNLNHVRYPSQNATFRFGLRWIFVN